jgi:hypothetical protein
MQVYSYVVSELHPCPLDTRWKITRHNGSRWLGHMLGYHGDFTLTVPQTCGHIVCNVVIESGGSGTNSAKHQTATSPHRFL